MNTLARNESPTVALLIVDMINDLRLPESEKLFSETLPAARALVRLRQRMAGAGSPVIYVNDNFKQWTDSFATTIEHVSARSEMGREIAEIVLPDESDYYILKPHRSGFYKTPLEVLLRDLEVDTLVITGIATDICVLATAIDARMREFDILIPRDCTASIDAERRDAALRLLELTTEADIRPSTELTFGSQNDRGAT